MKHNQNRISIIKKIASSAKGEVFSKALTNVIFNMVFKDGNKLKTKELLLNTKPSPLEVDALEVLKIMDSKSKEDIDFSNLEIFVEISDSIDRTMSGFFNEENITLKVSISPKEIVNSYDNIAKIKNIDTDYLFNKHINNQYNLLYQTVLHEVEHYIQFLYKDRSSVFLNNKFVSEYPLEYKENDNKYTSSLNPIETTYFTTEFGYTYLKTQSEVAAFSREIYEGSLSTAKRTMQNELKKYIEQGKSKDEIIKEFKKSDFAKTIIKAELSMRILNLIISSMSSSIKEFKSVPGIKDIQSFAEERLNDLFSIYVLYIKSRYHISPNPLTTKQKDRLSKAIERSLREV